MSYRLGNTGPRDVRIYGRVTKALAGSREFDLASGVSVDPLPGIPIRAHAEMRATRISGRTLVRPQAFVTAQFAEPLPWGVEVAGYGQAGYVGGKFATAFVDGQLKIDRPFVDALGIAIAGGAGVWGGAQDDAGRLDIGPSVTGSFAIADTPIRIALDYRQRIAGSAAPGSGPALTISAGF